MDPPVPEPLRARIAAAVALLLVAAVTAAALLYDRSTPAVADPATGADFDTERAWAHLEEIAGEEPTPTSSAGNTEVRDHLVAHLEALGLEVEVQQAVGARAFGGSITAGRVDNVLATLPGTEPTGRVYLAAHYDTTPTTPGAGDDKHAVAAILEAARALSEADAPRNDIVFLLTDGEEPGLIGAEAFVEHHPYAADGGVVVNLEGAGNAGPAKLYNTSPGNAALVEVWAAAAPHPRGESGMAALWEATPSNSDFTTLAEAGFHGMEFSPLDGRAYYHHPRDTAESFAPETLHHQGAGALALAAELGERDLTELGAGHDATFAALFGTVLRYPGWLVWPSALLALAGAVGLTLLVLRGGAARAGRILGAVGVGLLAVLASAAGALGLWALLTVVRPDYDVLMWGDPYHPGPYRAAILAISLSLTWGIVLLVRRRLGPEAISVTVALWPVLLGLATAALVPPMAYAGTLAALGCVIGMLAARRAGGRRPVWRAAALGAGVLPGVLLLCVNGYALTAVMGLEMGAAVGAVHYALAALLVASLLFGVVPEQSRPRPALVPLGAALVATTLIVVGLVADTVDEEHPHTAHLFYVLDADTGEALWASADARPHDWVAGYVPDRHDGEPLALPVPPRTRVQWTGEAEPVEVPAPELEATDVRTTAAGAVVDLRLRSPRGADVLSLHLDRPVTGGTLRVAGREAIALPPIEPEAGAPGEWPYEIAFHNPASDGVELSLHLAGAERPSLGVSDYSFGLEDVPGFTERPPEVAMTPSSGGNPTDSVVVVRTHEW